MTIYQVVYYNQYGEKVADFGYYSDRLDAENRAFEVRMKAPLESGEVRIEDVYVHESAQDQESETTVKQQQQKKRQSMGAYILKPDEKHKK